MAGYSGTPLRKKLGVKDEMRLKIISPPDDYFNWIEAKPEINRKGKSDFDFVHAFYTKQYDFIKAIPTLVKAIKKDGILWISWPKKSSKMQTDMTEHVARNLLLEAGLVDVKVCAVSEVWSGLKFVYRLKDR